MFLSLIVCSRGVMKLQERARYQLTCSRLPRPIGGTAVTIFGHKITVAVGLKPRLRIAAVLFALAIPSMAAAEPGGWQITETSSPLTNQTTVSALLDSSNELVNMLGRPERASLVLRCKDQALVVYVTWPEMVNQDSENFAGQPKTVAIWRIDDGPLQNNFWSISSTGTAAGEFASRNSAKLIASFFNASKLAVRLSGRMTQDAGFDLAGFNEVATKVAGACGTTFQTAK